jgi:hypothetical protein
MSIQIICNRRRFTSEWINDTERRFPRTLAEAFRTADYGAAIERPWPRLADQIKRAGIWTAVFIVCALLAVACVVR